MNRLHLAAIAAVVAGAVALGGVAISSQGGSASPATAVTQPAGAQTVTQRTAALDALEASLDRQLAEAAGAPNTQPADQPDTSGSTGDDHGGWERDDDNGSDDD